MPRLRATGTRLNIGKLGSVGGTIEIRLGSPDGRLLARTDVGVAAQPPGVRAFRPPPVTVAIPATQGAHDVPSFASGEGRPVPTVVTFSGTPASLSTVERRRTIVLAEPPADPWWT
jgi:hypothetical protein